MFKQIVSGVDEHHGDDAVALARMLLDADGELTLAHVHRSDAHMQLEDRERFAAAERERSRRVLETVRDRAGVDAGLRWRGSDSVGRGLHELCEALAADLLVVGSSRGALVGRLRMPDDTRAALDGAPCAVAIAPVGLAGEPRELHEIGVGYDASPESEHALAVARTLAAQAGAKLSAFEAVAFPSSAFGSGRPLLRSAIDALVDGARERIAGLRGVEPRAAYGEPAEELSIYSAGLDLLVIGARGYGPVGRLIHGSTSRELTRSARCSLLVLPRAGREATERPAGEG